MGSSSEGASRRVCGREALYRQGEPFRAVYVLRAGSCKSVLVAPDGASLSPGGVWHLDASGAYDGFRAAVEHHGFPMGVGLPGRVLESGEPASILDLAVVALAVMVCGTLGLLAWTLGISVPVAALRARRDIANQRARLAHAERRLRSLTEGDR